MKLESWNESKSGRMAMNRSVKKVGRTTTPASCHARTTCALRVRCIESATNGTTRIFDGHHVLRVRARTSGHEATIMRMRLGGDSIRPQIVLSYGR